MEIKTSEQIKLMREGGQILARILNLLKKSLREGTTTKELAQIAASELRKLGGKAAFLNYQGYPDVICVSVNDEVVHGIPGERVLKNGDVVGLDFGVIYGGFITDSALTAVVGNDTNPKVDSLISATEKALANGIKMVRSGVSVGDISNAIEKTLKAKNLGVIETLVGHGVGKKLHEPPEIPNFGLAGQGPILGAGMTIAIEPMATIGDKEVYLAEDGWSVRTVDGSLSAHFEHTVLVTESGAEILTRQQ